MDLYKYLCLQQAYAYSDLPWELQSLFLCRTYACNRLIIIRVFRRSYRAHSYSEIPVGITDQNDTPSFPLIHYSGYYHITMGIPRPVLINE